MEAIFTYSIIKNDFSIDELLQKYETDKQANADSFYNYKYGDKLTFTSVNNTHKNKIIFTMH